jgi:hypothetical protein
MHEVKNLNKILQVAVDILSEPINVRFQSNQI